MSDFEGNSLGFPSGLEGKQNYLTGFLRDLTLSVLLYNLAFHFNSNKRITGAHQNSLLST